MLKIGYTGTQRGMTALQCRAIWDIVWRREFIAHHGDCVGGDAQFDVIVRRATGCQGVVIHPCDLDAKRAYCEIRQGVDILREVKTPLDRNRDIVAEIDLLIAGPGEMIPKQRSGTWTTVRYAQEARRRLMIVFPNGAVVRDSWIDDPA